MSLRKIGACKMIKVRTLLPVVLAILFNASAFAGKDEIRTFLSKQAIVKYGKGADSGEPLLLAAGMFSWNFRPYNQGDNTIGEIVRGLGFKEILEAENMLDTTGRVSEQNMLWIREVLSEYIDLSDVKIVYGKFEFSHPQIEGTKIIYSIGLQNITLTKANRLLSAEQ